MSSWRVVVLLLIPWVAVDFATPPIESPFASRTSEWEDVERDASVEEAAVARRPRPELKTTGAPSLARPRLEQSDPPRFAASLSRTARLPREWLIPSVRRCPRASDLPSPLDDH